MDNNFQNNLYLISGILSFVSFIGFSLLPQKKVEIKSNRSVVILEAFQKELPKIVTLGSRRQLTVFGIDRRPSSTSFSNITEIFEAQD